VNRRRGTTQERMDRTALEQQHHDVIQRVPERDRALLQNRMLQRSDQDESAGDKRDGLQPVRQDTSRNDAQIRRAVPNTAHDLLAHALAHVDVDVWMGMEIRGHHGRKIFRNRGTIGQQAELAS
jgi:hypothetical protein